MHREINFEDGVELDLLEHGGYDRGDAHAYDPTTALFPAEVVAFVQRSQPKVWERLVRLTQEKAAAVLVESLVKELASKGMLTVLRQGFKCYGSTVRAVFFTPNTYMNPAAWAAYKENRLTVTRQVHTASGAIPDVVLAVNGLPVATLELKNPMSGQRAADAIHQYRFERNPNELLFTFKQRCLVHFAVDTDAVWMTTRLEGKASHFLPFNRGHNHSAGNPPAPDDVRTFYLWREVLAAESLLDILARFLHLQVEEKTVATAQGLQQSPRRRCTARAITSSTPCASWWRTPRRTARGTTI